MDPTPDNPLLRGAHLASRPYTGPVVIGWIRQLSLASLCVIMIAAQPDLRSILALTITALAVALACAILTETVAPQAQASATATGREARIAPRHCDPDAAGRPRPRAPTAA